MEYADIGQKKYEEFVKNRLLSDSQMSVWDPMKKLSLKTFTNLHKKKKTMAQNKVVKLKEERQFFASFLVLQNIVPSWPRNFRLLLENRNYHTIQGRFLVLTVNF